MALDTKTMSHPTRRRIFNYILENPGRHFGEIKRKLGLSRRKLSYHLKKMLEEGIIISQSKSVFKYYYPKGAKVEPKPLTPMQENVVEILREGPTTTREVANMTGKSRQSAVIHLMKLRDKGFVDGRRIGNGYEWYVK